MTSLLFRRATLPFLPLATPVLFPKLTRTMKSLNLEQLSATGLLRLQMVAAKQGYRITSIFRPPVGAQPR